MNNWFEKRYRLGEVVAGLLQPPIPLHRTSVQYGIGGALLFLLGVQVVTGILLMVYYVPAPASAYASVEMIQTRVPFGAIVRSIHSWSSHLLIAGVLLHLAVSFTFRSYRRPRELTWVGGIMMLGILLAIGFSGRVLPQDETAHYGSLIGISLVEKTPLVGEFLGRLVKGTELASEVTLSRFFAFHVVILPLLLVALQAFHLFAVHRQGLSVPLKIERSGAEVPTLPFAEYLPRQLLVWVFLANVLVILALFRPAELGPEADPLAPIPPGIKPEWYFWPLYQMHRILPPRIFGLEAEVVFNVVLMVIGGLVVALPFWDRASRDGIAGKGVTVLGLMTAIVLAGFSGWAWLG